MKQSSEKPTAKRRYLYLLDLVRQTRPKSILEIGTWKGKHARLMLEEALRFGSVHYYGFDLFDSCPLEEFPKAVWKKTPMEKIQKVLEGTGAKVSLFKGNTRETLASVSLPMMDFIFIDGGHSLETIENDWNHCEKLMHSKSVVVMDDYWNRTDAGCRPLVDDVIGPSGNYRVEMLGIADRADVSDIQMVKITRRSPS